MPARAPAPAAGAAQPGDSGLLQPGPRALCASPAEGFTAASLTGQHHKYTRCAKQRWCRRRDGGPGPSPPQRSPLPHSCYPSALHFTSRCQSLPFLKCKAQPLQAKPSASRPDPANTPPAQSPPASPAPRSRLSCPGARPRTRGAGVAGGQALPLPCPHHGGEGQKESTSSTDRKTGMVSIFCKRGSHIPIFLG